MERQEPLMKAAVALLAPAATANAVAQVAWAVHRRWQTGLGVRRLPPHISLKQPFHVLSERLPELVVYLQATAAFLPPLPITLTSFYASESGQNVLGYTVEKAETLADPLRDLHERLNRELPSVVGTDAVAPFDGDDYRFHLTVAAGGVSPAVYREEILPFCRETYTVPAPFLASELALFVYDPPATDGGQWEYFPYAIFPLTGRHPI